jgi:hypothetical protein
MHASQDLSSKTPHREYATQTELKSLTQSFKCMEAESVSLRMFLVSLVVCSMRLGVPFIAPRRLGAVGGQLGRLILPSIEWWPRPPPAPPHTPTIHVRCTISFYIGRSRRCSLGLVGAPDTVRCTPDSSVHLADRWSWPRVTR